MKKIINKLINSLLKPIIRISYPQFKRNEGYTTYWIVFKRYFIWQKIIGINRKIPWPVHFSSVIYDWKNITKGICTDPGDNIGIYINASGGLRLGNNVSIGANSTVTTINHYKYDHRKLGFKKGITIGDNVWIGANCSITAGVTIGDNVTIGAGCVIRTDIPSNVTVIESGINLEIIPKKRDYEWDCTKDKLM